MRVPMTVLALSLILGGVQTAIAAETEEPTRYETPQPPPQPSHTPHMNQPDSITSSVHSAGYVYTYRWTWSVTHVDTDGNRTYGWVLETDVKWKGYNVHENEMP